MGEFQFEMRLRVRPEEIDEQGHVNNAVYLHYVEAVARGHSESVGLTRERYHELGGMFLVRRHVVNYHRPAFDGDELTLRTRIKSASGVRTVRQVFIARGEDLLVDVETDWVWVDRESGRPKKLPTEFLKKLPAVTTAD